MEYSGFFNANLQDGSYDRVYLAEQFAAYFAKFVGNGVFAGTQSNLKVTSAVPESMKVSVSLGSAFINGYWYELSQDPLLLTVPTADGRFNRVDGVYVQLNYTERAVKVVLKEGTASDDPQFPAKAPDVQRDAGIYELKLADIRVKPGASKITNADITDTRQDKSVCGIVTGAVEQIDVTDLFLQYNEAFNQWFDEMKNQLSTDAAGNLQNQIGILRNLSTDAKDSLVSALNEVAAKVNDIKNNTIKSVSSLISNSLQGKYVDALVLKEVVEAFTPKVIKDTTQKSANYASGENVLSYIDFTESGWYMVGTSVNAPGKPSGSYLIVAVKLGKNDESPDIWTPIAESGAMAYTRFSNSMLIHLEKGDTLYLTATHNDPAIVNISYIFYATRIAKDL